MDVFLPKPLKEDIEGFKKEGVIFGKIVDIVLCRANVPKNFVIKKNKVDHRFRVILNEFDELVASIFLQEGRTYRGYICLKNKRIFTDSNYV